ETNKKRQHQAHKWKAEPKYPPYIIPPPKTILFPSTPDQSKETIPPPYLRQKTPIPIHGTPLWHKSFLCSFRLQRAYRTTVANVLGNTPSLPQFTTHAHNNPWQALVVATGRDVVLLETRADVMLVGWLVGAEDEDNDEDREVGIDELGNGRLLPVLVAEAWLPPRPTLTQRRPTQLLVGVAEPEFELGPLEELVMALGWIPGDEGFDVDELTPLLVTEAELPPTPTPTEAELPPKPTLTEAELPPTPTLAQRRPTQPLVGVAETELGLEPPEELVTALGWVPMDKGFDVNELTPVLLTEAELPFSPRLTQTSPLHEEAPEEVAAGSLPDTVAVISTPALRLRQRGPVHEDDNEVTVASAVGSDGDGAVGLIEGMAVFSTLVKLGSNDCEDTTADDGSAGTVAEVKIGLDIVAHVGPKHKLEHEIPVQDKVVGISMLGIRLLNNAVVIGRDTVGETSRGRLDGTGVIIVGIDTVREESRGKVDTTGIRVVGKDSVGEPSRGKLVGTGTRLVGRDSVGGITDNVDGIEMTLDNAVGIGRDSVDGIRDRVDGIGMTLDNAVGIGRDSVGGITDNVDGIEMTLDNAVGIGSDTVGEKSRGKLDATGIRVDGRDTVGVVRDNVDGIEMTLDNAVGISSDTVGEKSRGKLDGTGIRLIERDAVRERSRDKLDGTITSVVGRDTVGENSRGRVVGIEITLLGTGRGVVGERSTDKVVGIDITLLGNAVTGRDIVGEKSTGKIVEISTGKVVGIDITLLGNAVTGKDIVGEISTDSVGIEITLLGTGRDIDGEISTGIVGEVSTDSVGIEITLLGNAVT
ncbi:MAG: hypothetical protein Q9196_006935, partial [Gyalolechia fulgens]